jgi:hypothetical protein
MTKINLSKERGLVFSPARMCLGRVSKSMNHAQKYLAQANRHIAELTVQIAQ